MKNLFTNALNNVASVKDLNPFGEFINFFKQITKEAKEGFNLIQNKTENAFDNFKQFQNTTEEAIESFKQFQNKTLEVFNQIDLNATKEFFNIVLPIFTFVTGVINFINKYWILILILIIIVLYFIISNFMIMYVKRIYSLFKCCIKRRKTKIYNDKDLPLNNLPQLRLDSIS